MHSTIIQEYQIKKYKNTRIHQYKNTKKYEKKNKIQNMSAGGRTDHSLQCTALSHKNTK